MYTTVMCFRLGKDTLSIATIICYMPINLMSVGSLSFARGVSVGVRGVNLITRGLLGEAYGDSLSVLSGFFINAWFFLAIRGKPDPSSA